MLWYCFINAWFNLEYLCISRSVTELNEQFLLSSVFLLHFSFQIKLFPCVLETILQENNTKLSPLRSLFDINPNLEKITINVDQTLSDLRILKELFTTLQNCQLTIKHFQLFTSDDIAIKLRLVGFATSCFSNARWRRQQTTDTA